MIIHDTYFYYFKQCLWQLFFGEWRRARKKTEFWFQKLILTTRKLLSWKEIPAPYNSFWKKSKETEAVTERISVCFTALALKPFFFCLSKGSGISDSAFPFAFRRKSSFTWDLEAQVPKVLSLIHEASLLIALRDKLASLSFPVKEKDV